MTQTKNRFARLRSGQFNLLKVQIVIAILCIFAVGSLFFKRIMDPESRKGARKEFLVFHYTACPWPSGNAVSVATFLKQRKNAGAHWVVDDKQWIQCAEETASVPAVGGKKWRNWVPIPWLKDRITNANSINYEVCLGWDRDNVKMVDTTAKAMAFTLVRLGLEVGAIAKHEHAKGKPCPFFGVVKLTPDEYREYYNSSDPKKTRFWNQAYEDAQFYKFKKLVRFYQLGHLYRLGKIDWTTYVNFVRRDVGEKAAAENKYNFTF